MELPSSLLMFISSRHAEERIVEHLRAHGFADLTLAQGRLAARVAEGGSRVTELAEAAQVTKQTAGFLVNQLEKGGYVERVPIRPTPGRGWCGWRSAARRPRPAPARWSRSSRPSGSSASARARCVHCANRSNNLRNITDPFI